MNEIGNHKVTPEFEEMIAKHKREKSIAIKDTITNLAANISSIAKTLPKDGKKNPFVKSYNRRPRNNQKRALAFAQIAINTQFAKSQAYMIASQPIPKFKSGGINRSAGIAIADSNVKEVIQRLNGDIIPIIPTSV